MKMAECPQKGTENTVERVEIARYEQFLLFPVFKRLVLQTYENTGVLGEIIKNICNTSEIDTVIHNRLL